jgi:GGDEF domain-containing protein
VPVSGTPWRIVVTEPNAGLYAPINGASRWLEWVGLFGLGFAGLIIIALGAHLLRSRARLAALNTTLDRVGRIDSLTGLSNRRDIEEHLATAHSFARRRHQSLAVLLIDIDHFKRVNDTLGHQVGDSVLVQTAAAIRSALRLEDSLGRWGGEEFLVVVAVGQMVGTVASRAWLSGNPGLWWAPWCAWGASQAPGVAIRCWWSLSRLCVMAANRHSLRTAVRPLRWNLSIRRLYLICPNTGSIVW